MPDVVAGREISWIKPLGPALAAYRGQPLADGSGLAVNS